MANRLSMDLYEVDIQVSRSHRTPKSVYDKKYGPILVQFVNWRYAEDIHKKLTGLHASNKSKDVFKEPYKSQESISVEKNRNNKRIAGSIRVFGFSSKTNG